MQKNYLADNLEKPKDTIYRYETKFFIQNMDRNFIENMISHHPAFFSEIYHSRHINNIYFDNLNLSSFHDNIDGNTDRIKYRIRWYGKIFGDIEKAKLELKIKKGLVGTKRTFDINAFKFNTGFDLSEIKTSMLNSYLDSRILFALQDKLPVMLNRYKRTYFETNDKKFRITIDDCQEFYRLNNYKNSFLQKYKDSSNVIVEVKYDIRHKNKINQITNRLPFRVTKSSKYSRGIQLLYY